MPAFNGTLNPNEIFAAIYNMIISQEVFADNIYDTKSTLADRSRVDGGLYGDSKLFYSTDVLKSFVWGVDAEAENLLKLHRPADPECQVIEIDKFRMIPLTVDNYLTKRAWSTEGAFSQFNSQMLGWMRDTKRIYDATLFNAFIGTHTAGTANDGTQNKSITLAAAPATGEAELEAYNRNVAQTIAAEMADLIVDLEDVSRDFNDYGNLRSYNANDLVFVWNSEWVNKIKKLDVPTIFHKDGLIDKFAENVLPARYFGTVNATSGTTASTNTTIRSLIEKDYNTTTDSGGNTVVLPMDHASYDPKKHIFPGDLLPASTAYGAGETYTQDSTIVFKVYHKRSVPFMTAFETGTEFFNQRSLTQTHYLIWGYNDLETLKNYPFITFKAATAAPSTPTPST